MLGSAGWVVTGWVGGIKLDPKPELGDARSQITLFLCGDGAGVSKEATCPNSEKWLNQDNELHWKDLKNAVSLLPWLLYLLGDIKGQCIAKYYTLGGLKWQKSLVAQFWRLEAWNQGAGRAGFSWELWGRNRPRFSPRSGEGPRSLLPWLVDH